MAAPKVTFGIMLTGRVDGLTRLVAKLCSNLSPTVPVRQVDVFRTEPGGDVHVFDFDIDEDGILSRREAWRYPDLDAALAGMTETYGVRVTVLSTAGGDDRS